MSPLLRVPFLFLLWVSAAGAADPLIAPMPVPGVVEIKIIYQKTAEQGPGGPIRAIAQEIATTAEGRRTVTTWSSGEQTSNYYIAPYFITQSSPRTGGQISVLNADQDALASAQRSNAFPFLDWVRPEHLQEGGPKDEVRRVYREAGGPSSRTVVVDAQTLFPVAFEDATKRIEFRIRTSEIPPLRLEGKFAQALSDFQKFIRESAEEEQAYGTYQEAQPD